MNPRPVKLSEVTTDAGTQTRCFIDDRVVTEYAERMIEGDKFPPVVVFHDGNRYLLADGFHRVLAAGRNGFKDILADVMQGTKSDALKFSLGANDTHGLPRSNADKRRCVELALASFADMSDRAIAEMCGVGNDMVGDRRKEISQLSLNDSSKPRKGKDGKTRKLPAQPDEEEDPDHHVVIVEKVWQRKPTLERWAKGVGARLDEVVRHQPWRHREPNGLGGRAGFDTVATFHKWSFGDKSCKVVYFPHSVTPLQAPRGSRERRAVSVPLHDEEQRFEQIVNAAVISSGDREAYDRDQLKDGDQLEDGVAHALTSPTGHEVPEPNDTRLEDIEASGLVDELADYEIIPRAPSTTGSMIIFKGLFESLLTATTILDARHHSFVWPVWRDCLSGCAPASQAGAATALNWCSIKSTAERLQVGFPLCLNVVSAIVEGGYTPKPTDREVFLPVINAMSPVFAQFQDHRFVFWATYNRVFGNLQWVEICGRLGKNRAQTSRFKERLRAAIFDFQRLASPVQPSPLECRATTPAKI